MSDHADQPADGDSSKKKAGGPADGELSKALEAWKNGEEVSPHQLEILAKAGTPVVSFTDPQRPNPSIANDLPDPVAIASVAVALWQAAKNGHPSDFVQEADRLIRSARDHVRREHSPMENAHPIDLETGIPVVGCGLQEILANPTFENLLRALERAPLKHKKPRTILGAITTEKSIVALVRKAEKEGAFTHEQVERILENRGVEPDELSVLLAFQKGRNALRGSKATKSREKTKRRKKKGKAGE